MQLLTWFSALVSSRWQKISSWFFLMKSSVFMFMVCRRTGQRPWRAFTDTRTHTGRQIRTDSCSPVHAEVLHLPMDGWWEMIRVSMARFSASTRSPHWLAAEQMTHSASSRIRGGT